MPKLPISIFLPALFVFILPESQATAAVPAERQDIWRVSVRAVTRLRINDQNFSRLKYYRWQNNRWNLSDAETFFETQQPEIPLIVFAPGYSSSTPQTTHTGRSIVRYFDPDKPCRVVFLDWYAEKGTSKISRDIRSKIPVVNNTADYLAMLVQTLKPQSKVCLFGFSYGSRIVCNAAETLRQNNHEPEGLRLHLVLSGSATDRNWFAKGNRHEHIPQIAEKILVTYNSDDWALRFYSLLYGLRSNVTALGAEGLPMRSIAPEYRSRFENVDVNRYIGSEHQTLFHVRTPVFRSRINAYFFFE